MKAVDTNVLVYALDVDDPTKQSRAVALLRQLRNSPSQAVVLWQVAAEFLCCLRRWQNQGRISASDVEAHIQDVLSTSSLMLPKADVLTISLNLGSRYSLSHWDSMLLAACIEAGVDTLYSEDLSAGMTYDSVTVVNPFV